jgi:hypothetical protein
MGQHPGFGQSSVVKAVAPDLLGASAQDPASVFVSPEIRKEVQSALFEVVGDRIGMHAERPRFARPPNRSQNGCRTLKRHTSVQNARMDVRENEPPTSSQAAHPSGYRVNCLRLQIIRNSIPNNDSPLEGVESRLYQTFRWHLSIEVNWHESHMCKVGA